MAVISSKTRHCVRITLGVISAIVGLIFLSQSSFFKIQFNNTTSSRFLVFASLSALLIFLVFVAASWSELLQKQFEDAENLKGVCFITFALLLGYSLLKAPNFINRVAKKCHGQYLVQTMVKSFFFMIVSVEIFMTKYPRFRIHSKYIGSCGVEKGERVFQGNQFDVFTTGSFSLFALTISSEREQPVKLGMFSFLLELTMDTSIEILGNDGPNFLYILGALVYCVLLILVKSYLDSLMECKGSSVEQQDSYQDQVENSIVLNARGITSGHEQEQPLIESKTEEEKEHEIIDNELGLGETNNTEVGEASDRVTREYINTGDEACEDSDNDV
ncbi:uncharacterized protein LOC133802112 isoform X2 [Humulus lupulus]|uniref:uncharacterized protein LOC133802112 isoform X2 n=1 Tax=Humulus lupulus TaxID=3486 RepID=UPI002B409FB8|nr:uncharacterized protein LOC133802112 isoform X2 [Humulus lupulus]